MTEPTTALTNLLPADAARAVRRGYFMRLAGVIVIALSLLLVVHALLLLPSYIYLKREVADRTQHLAQLDQALAQDSDKQAAQRLTAIRDNAAYLETLSAIPTSSGAVRLVLSVPHAGVTLSGFSYGPTPDGKQQSMRVTGTAATRDALRNYDLALSSVPWASSVDLPISAYASESNISFSLTIEGSFQTP
jgi:Tfp pilus assembly protein PilN